MKPTEVYLFREVEPYLNRLFPNWKLVALDGENGLFGRAFVRVETATMNVELTRDYEEDALSFYPDMEQRPQKVTLSVPRIQRLLRERLPRQSITKQLEWLENHYVWRHRWEDRRVYDAYVKQEVEVRGPIRFEFMSDYWGKGLRESTQKHSPGPSPSTGRPLLDRSSAFFEYLLGSDWRTIERPEALYGFGKWMSLRISVDDGEEVLSVGPAAESIDEIPEWIDVRRIVDSFEEDELGRTVETKLAYLAPKVSQYELICRPEWFPRFSQLLSRAEASDAVAFHILTGEAVR